MNAADYQASILAEVEGGADEKNAVFSIALPIGVTAGNWRIGFNGSLATVPYNVTAGALLSALQALDTVGMGNINVTGFPKGPYYLEMIGANARQPVPLPTVDGSTLTPAAVLQPVQERYPVMYRYAADVVTIWNSFATDGAYSCEPLGLRRLRVLKELLRRECNRLSEQVNITDGVEQKEMSDAFKAKSSLLAQATRDINEYRELENQGQAFQSHYGDATAGAQARSGYERMQRGWPFGGRGCG